MIYFTDMVNSSILSYRLSDWFGQRIQETHQIRMGQEASVDSVNVGDFVGESAYCRTRHFGYERNGRDKAGR